MAEPNRWWQCSWACRSFRMGSNNCFSNNFHVDTKFKFETGALNVITNYDISGIRFNTPTIRANRFEILCVQFFSFRCPPAGAYVTLLTTKKRREKWDGIN